MDCISEPDSEQARYGERPVSPLFHFAVIERAIAFARGCAGSPTDAAEVQLACDEAQQALAELRLAFIRA